MKCKQCHYENTVGTNYCQHCGKKLETGRPSFKWGNNKHLAGVGQRGSSLAPLGAMAIEKQADSLGKVAIHKNLVKVSPLEDGRWYCPDCGELNPKYSITCKGCGRDYI